MPSFDPFFGFDTRLASTITPFQKKKKLSWILISMNHPTYNEGYDNFNDKDAWVMKDYDPL